MKLSVLLAVAVAASTLTIAHGEIRRGVAVAGEVDTFEEEYLPMMPSRFRQLQAGSGGGDPTTPPPTTPTPTPTTPEPTTPEPTTPEPTTPEVTTPAPTTDTPAPTTPGETTTEPPSTDAPSTDIESPSDSASKSGSNEESSGNGNSTDKASSSSKAGANSTNKDSGGSNTITIVAIVGGIVVGVALLAFVAVSCARKRRDEDDDPLSPFELSMDKGYNGAPTYNNNNVTNNVTNNAALAYSGVRTATNSAGAAPFGASQQNNNNTRQQTTQFYDVVTSPGSQYHQEQAQMYKKHSSEEVQAKDTSLWMSAMEPKHSEAEGASVPPEVSIPGDEIDKNFSSFVSAGSRNSYDAVSEEIDIDQSSVISGGSDLEKEFPDFEDESSRGSYEL